MKTSNTKEAELTNSFAYTALASQYIMSRLLTKALKNRDQQPPCIASEHLEIVPHADRMINSSELQLVLHNTQEKKGKTFLLKFNTYSKLLIIQDGFKCHDTHLKTLNAHLCNKVNFMDACGHIRIFSYLSVFQNILFIILYK